MVKRMCVGALALSFLVSLAVLPAAAAKVVEDLRTLVTFDFRFGSADVR